MPQVQPIFFRGTCVLFAARLQDYSHRLTRLVSLQPAQFCKSGSCFQYRVRLGDLKSARSFSQARVVDVTAAELGADVLAVEGEDDPAAEQNRAGAPGASTAPAGQQLPSRHVKRLGFGGLMLEPEYLLDRLRHECADLDMPCVAQELEVGGTEVMRMEIRGDPRGARGAAAGAAAEAPTGGASGGGAASSSAVGGAALAPADALGHGLRAVVHVMPEDEDGTYAISLMRLVGDTFEFHSLYRKLRERLADITLLAPGGGGGGGLGGGGYGGPKVGLGGGCSSAAAHQLPSLSGGGVLGEKAFRPSLPMLAPLPDVSIDAPSDSASGGAR